MPMIIICRNIRGQERTAKRLAVRRMVKSRKINVMLLQEIKIHKDIDSSILGVQGSRTCDWECVSSDGASGGLVMIRNGELVVKFQSLHYNLCWEVACIYGLNEEADMGAS